MTPGTSPGFFATDTNSPQQAAPCLLPSSFDAFLATDALFARAYDAMPAHKRAWIKKLLAQLYSMQPTAGKEAENLLRQWKQGFFSLEQKQPVAVAALFIDQKMSSAPLCAAATLPVMTAGAQAVCCVRVQENTTPPPADDILAALELCGMEAVYTLDLAAAADFLDRVQKSGSVRILALSSHRLCSSDSLKESAQKLDSAPLEKLFQTQVLCHTTAVCQLPLPHSIGIWKEKDSPWDYTTIQWAHPHTPVAVWNEPDSTALPASCHTLSGPFSEFLLQGYHALYVPSALCEQALSAAQVVLCPGQEGCWIWPGMYENFFSQKRAGLG